MESNSQNLPSEVPFSFQKPPKSNADTLQEGEVQNSISQNENDEQENSSQTFFRNASYPDEIERGILISLPTSVPNQDLNHQSDDEEGNDSQSETSSCSHSSQQDTSSSSDSSSLDRIEPSPIGLQATSLLELYVRDYDIDPSETSDYSDVVQESSQISIQSSHNSISSSVSSNRCIFLFDPMNDGDENASMMSLDYQYFDLD